MIVFRMNIHSQKEPLQIDRAAVLFVNKIIKLRFSELSSGLAIGSKYILDLVGNHVLNSLTCGL